MGGSLIVSEVQQDTINSLLHKLHMVPVPSKNLTIKYDLLLKMCLTVPLR